MPVYDYKLLLCEGQVVMNAADEYSDAEVNFGIVSPDKGKGGMFGLHVVVTTAFTGLASGCEAWIVHGAATTPTTKKSGRFLAVAQMVAGAHFFIPCAPGSLLQYARALFHPVSEVATAGAVTAYFGPDVDGSI